MMSRRIGDKAQRSGGMVRVSPETTGDIVRGKTAASGVDVSAARCGERGTGGVPSANTARSLAVFTAFSLVLFRIRQRAALRPLQGRFRAALCRVRFVLSREWSGSCE
jgi:hypothetical protein